MIFLLFSLVTLLMQYRLWFGVNSLPEYWQLQVQVQQQRDQNTQLSKRNQALNLEIMDLKQGLEAVEERARYELGLIKPNETFYRIVPSPQ
ncbi:MAG: cell division protein FtsB [Shewanellaceae bacterium]|nr:cell division protein FtsB [Shewanellaceae bacterium]